MLKKRDTTFNDLEILLLFYTVVCAVMSLLCILPLIWNARYNSPSVEAQSWNTPEWKGWKAGSALGLIAFFASAYFVTTEAFNSQYISNLSYDANNTLVTAQAAAFTVMVSMFVLSTSMCLFSNAGSQAGKAYMALYSMFRERQRRGQDIEMVQIAAVEQSSQRALLGPSQS